jgi:hypothetical protein
MDAATSLAQRIAPVALAHQRRLPVGERVRDLLPDAGLVRGRIVSCRGSAATTIALSLVAEATASGSWMAVVDVPTIGLDAAGELGVALDRLVAIRTSLEPRHWADVVVAAADGFDLVVTRVPADLRPALGRSVATRVRRSGSVLIVLGDPGAVACDGVVRTTRERWDGLGDGHGNLRRRIVDVHVSGRRFPDRRCEIRLAG